MSFWDCPSVFSSRSTVEFWLLCHLVREWLADPLRNHFFRWAMVFSNTPFRAQTEALLRGKLALSDSPTDLGVDLCWSEGGVHQVWGLGVPLWRLPFEALARVFGHPAFSDRLAMGLFMALVAYIALSTWLAPVLNRASDPACSTVSSSSTNPPASYGSTSRNAGRREMDWAQLITAFGAVMLLLLFPPLLSPLRYRMLVFEEVMVYVFYLFGNFLADLRTESPWRETRNGGGFGVSVLWRGRRLGAAHVGVLWCSDGGRDCADVCRLPRPLTASRRAQGKSGRTLAHNHCQESGSTTNNYSAVDPAGCFWGSFVCLGRWTTFATNPARLSGWEFGHSLNVPTRSISWGPIYLHAL